MATRSSRPPSRSTEPLGVLVSCVGALAILASIVPALAAGPLGVALLGFALLAVAAHVVVAARAGVSVARALVEALLVAGGAFALVYGSVWLLGVYLAGGPGFLSTGGRGPARG